jgi:hypothetical protein
VIEPPAEDFLDHADSYVQLMGEPCSTHRINSRVIEYGER